MQIYYYPKFFEKFLLQGILFFILFFFKYLSEILQIASICDQEFYNATKT